jgi:single-stranded DNA-binding protein
MSTVNKIFLLGYLGKEPEDFSNEKRVMAADNLAANEFWKDKNNQE